MLALSEFTESDLKTKNGQFIIRVYKDQRNCETVVLYTRDLDVSQPVLVRVHSECLTGDLLGSKHCDCGGQLDRSIKIISDKGGVLIYLRQEGRGIGLFEKIRAYQLQKEGLDTYEANVAIGHLPDARTYEMAKIALDDLEIKRVKLLTNNPSKISELEKLGIEVVERVPLIIPQNDVNKRYYEAKAKRFQHGLFEEIKKYSFQFPVNDVADLQEIYRYLKTKRLDKFQELCVAFSASSATLRNPQELKRLLELCAIAKGANFIPVLHFSFVDVKNPIDLLDSVCSSFSSFDRIQLNDLRKVTASLLKSFAKHFEVDLPIDNDQFSLLENSSFIKVLQKYSIKICLDNSKGRGVQDSFSVYKAKIEKLLEKGVNYIGVSGGFGPTSLSTYFKLRQFFKINLSVDAESLLKTENSPDREKIIHYLEQLIDYRDPKEKGIEQTRELLKKSRRNKNEKAALLGKDFVVFPEVFHPGIFPSTEWFAKTVLSQLKGPCDFCEVGSGSGAISCLVALQHMKSNVITTDINPYASKNTQKNAVDLGVGDQVRSYVGDVLSAIPPQNTFDYIFWAMPFGLVDSKEELTLEEKQVFDSGYKSIRKFFRQAKKHLKPKGKLLIGFSKDLGHTDLLQKYAEESGFSLSLLAKTILSETEDIQFELLEGKALL